ncbi:uncharacterized protein [Kogia breviceps]|uniref:uncharacterized protein n=1 Tax=Kogia breviceps TaxID=27615 RepID=UPI0034D2535D
MGNSSSAETAIEFHEPIQALLRDRGLKLSQKAINKLLQDIDGAAPWFAVSGSLTVPSWEKLGRDLTEHSKLGELSRCTLPLWRLIHSCLKGGGCEDIIQRGRKALSMCQDSASEGENVGTTVNRPKNPRRRKEKQAEKQGQAPRLYPLLDEFKALHLSQEELNPKEEAALEEAAAEYERGQYGSSPCARPPLYAPAAARASALVSLALFTINFLNVHDDDKTAAERHVALTHKEYSTVMWKDVLSNQWKGPDRVIARSRGSLCVSPQDQDPIWVPSRLTRSVEEKLERDAECRTDDATMDDHALNKSRVIGRFLAGNWSRELVIADIDLCTQRAVQGPETLALPGRLLEILHLWHHSILSQSEFVFQQDSQMSHMDIEVEKPQYRES